LDDDMRILEIRIQLPPARIDLVCAAGQGLITTQAQQKP
jgi:hypothetical protein